MARTIPRAVMARARGRARTAATRALIEEHRDWFAAEYAAALEAQLVRLGEIPGQLDIAAELAEVMR